MPLVTQEKRADARLVRRPRSVLSHLLLMVALPVCLLAVAAGAEGKALIGASTTAQSAVRGADQSSQLLGLYNALMTERTLASSLAAAGEFGLSPAAASRLWGSNLVAQLHSARVSLDSLIASDGWAIHIDTVKLATIRARVDAGRATARDVLTYFDGQAAAVRKLWGSVAAGISDPGAVQRSPELERALTALVDASDATALGWDRASAISSVVVPQFSASDETRQDLAAAAALYAEVVARLPSELSGSALREWQVAVVNNPAAQSFDHLIASTLAGTVVTPVANLATVTEQLRTGITLESSLAQVTALADQNVQSVAIGIHRNAARDLWLFLLAAIGMIALTIGGSIWLSRRITQPLERLARRAQYLSDGQLDGTPLPVGGPREIAISTQAFNDATAALGSLHAVVVAMATEQPEAANLALPLRGELGQIMTGALSRLTASIKDNRLLQDELRAQAIRDELTGLPNRRLIMEQLETMVQQSLRSGAPLTLLFIDLDHFKEVNDEFGHATGDFVLQETASRLARTCRAADVVGRLGGDEFVVITQSSVPRSVSLLQRIEKTLSAPIQICPDVAVVCPASVGMADISRQQTAEAMLDAADAAMYAAKSLRHSRASDTQPVVASA